GGTNPATLALRRAVEADRFGIVAHVLAVRDGCAPDECSAFAWLRDTGRINVNLAERPFEARLKTYAANWLAVGSREVVSTPPSPRTPAGAQKRPTPLSPRRGRRPPPANISPANPPPAQRQPQDTTGAAEAATPTPPRRPPQAGPPPRPPASAAPARSAPPPAPAQ